MSELKKDGWPTMKMGSVDQTRGTMGLNYIDKCLDVEGCCCSDDWFSLSKGIDGDVWAMR